MYSQITSNKRQSVALMMVFILIIIGLGYLFDISSGLGNYGGVLFAVGFSFGMTLISYFKGDKIALWSTGAKPITKEENAYLYRMVENLCITSGLPAPKIYIIEDSAINALATGRNPETATIAVTRGALEQLTNEELEGVLAHELSHVQNYDIRFMTLVVVLVGAISMLSNIFFHTIRSSRRNRDNGNAGVILMIVGLFFGILAPVVAEIIKLAISRRREYLADASGSLLTRYPEGLAKALEKIAAQNQPMIKADTATAHLFFANPFSGKKFASFFSTHPPIEDRIKKLREMA
ncbi:MAG: M48 family metallopeptidase [Candidatus Magasanikbacteria bacterium]|nr:M48 family metallopeptidase [Candidatus Magasanikbacteria bacterium]